MTQPSLFDAPVAPPPVALPAFNPSAVRLLNALADTAPDAGADIITSAIGHLNGHGAVVASSVGEWWKEATI